MLVAEHIVVSTRFRQRSLATPQQGCWLFEHLGRALRQIWSLVLMPDHLHLVLAAGQSAALRRVLTSFTRVFGVRLDVEEPVPAHTPAIAGRQMRYGFGNPLRAGLVDDPWAWPWSTLRDLGGAAYPRLTELTDVAARLHLAPRHAMRALTHFADLHVPPLAEEPPMVASRAALEAAIASALRFDPRARLDHPLGRQLAIQALLTLGMPSGRALADHLGCSTAAVRRLRFPPRPALPAVLQCLADPRLRAVQSLALLQRSA